MRTLGPASSATSPRGGEKRLASLDAAGDALPARPEAFGGKAEQEEPPSQRIDDEDQHRSREPGELPPVGTDEFGLFGHQRNLGPHRHSLPVWPALHSSSHARPIARTTQRIRASPAPMRTRARTETTAAARPVLGGPGRTSARAQGPARSREPAAGRDHRGWPGDQRRARVVVATNQRESEHARDGLSHGSRWRSETGPSHHDATLAQRAGRSAVMGRRPARCSRRCPPPWCLTDPHETRRRS